MFSVLFDYHSAIEVNYMHKIKKGMRQGSLRKTVKLMNRTTFKKLYDLINDGKRKEKRGDKGKRRWWEGGGRLFAGAD